MRIECADGSVRDDEPTLRSTRTTGVRERTTSDVAQLRARKASCQLRRVQLTHEYDNAMRDVNAAEVKIDRELDELERETRDTQPCSAPWSDDQAPSWSDDEGGGA